MARISHPQTGGLGQRNVSSSGSGGQKSEVHVSPGLVPGGGSQGHSGHASPVAVPSSSPGLLLRPGLGLCVSSPLYGQHRIGLGGGCLTARAKTLFAHEAPSQAPGGGPMFAQDNRHLGTRASEVLGRRRGLRPGASPPGAHTRTDQPSALPARRCREPRGGHGGRGGGSVRGVARGLARGAQTPAREQRPTRADATQRLGPRGGSPRAPEKAPRFSSGRPALSPLNPRLSSSRGSLHPAPT